MSPAAPALLGQSQVVWWAAALAALAVLGLGWWRWKRNSTVGAGGEEDRLDTVTGWPPQVTRLLTSAERLAFGTLVRALPEYVVLSQVPLSRFIDVPKRNSYAEWLRRVGYQSVDFLICDGASKVIAVVELRLPPAQTSPRASKRQARIARTLKAAEVPLYIWLETSLPPVESARDLILGRLQKTAAAAMPAGFVEAKGNSTETKVPPFAPVPAVNPFEESGRDSTQDEFIEARDLPPTTWYDDFDSGPTPLAPDKPRPRRR